jgi:hypothetical protein
MCVRGRQSRCSTVIAETVNSPVALLSLPVSSSWYPTRRSPVRRRRTQFVLAAVSSQLAAFAAIVALLYSRVAKLLQELCPFAFPRWTISRSFSRCWTSGHPVRNRGFVLVRQFLTILSRLNSRMDVCHPTDKVRSRGFGVLRAQLRRPVAGGQSVPFGYFSYSMWFARHKAAVRDRQKWGDSESRVATGDSPPISANQVPYDWSPEKVGGVSVRLGLVRLINWKPEEDP